VQVYFVSSDKRDFETSAFAAEWRERVGPGREAKAVQYNFNMGPERRRPVDVEISPRDDEVLEKAAADVVAALARERRHRRRERRRARQAPARPDPAPGGGQPRPQRADVARQVRAAFYGSEALRQQDGRNEVRVLVRLPDAERRNENDIADLLIRTPQGGEIPLREAAEIKRGRSWPSIERADGRRIIHVTADIRDGETTPALVLGKLTENVLSGLPDKYPGLSWGFGGENLAQRESLASLRSGALMALMAIYMLLAVPFRSYLQPVIVMAAIPFGLVGAIGGHVLLGLDLSIMSMMGMVALSGVVVNDSLVMVDATNEFHQRKGMPHFEAVAAAGARRFRPIMLTSITTFFGLAPMILEPSVQAKFLVPMAVSLGFGVMFATGITLLIVPALYLAVEDAKNGWRWLMGRPTESTEPAPVTARVRGIEPIDVEV
jgi:multidrug efflux pump subunit AcrB